MNTEITIIIPFYNPPKLRMRKCIESLMAQTFSDFEVLLIDDGNEEDFEVVFKEYLKKDKRFRLIKKEHAGVSAARNLGIEKAKGDYICFVDADDYVEPHYLSELYKAAQGNDLAICSIEEQWFPTRNIATDVYTMFSQPISYAWIQYTNFCHNKMLKASVIKENNLTFDEGIALGEDALFLAKFFRCADKVRIIPDRLYHYIPNPESAVNEYKEGFWGWEKNVIEVQWDLFHMYPLSKKQEMFLVRWLYLKFKHVMYYYAERCEDKNKKNQILDEIRNHPLYKELMNVELKKNKLFLNRNDRIIIRMWRALGAKGVALTKLIAKMV